MFIIGEKRSIGDALVREQGVGIEFELTLVVESLE